MDVRNQFPILKFFKYEHLPPILQEISKPFCTLAESMVDGVEADIFFNRAEVAASLRKLLEAKDCAVRAAIE